MDAADVWFKGNKMNRNPGICPYCGSNSFYIQDCIEYSADFDVSHDGSVSVCSREFGNTKIRKRIYCSKCNRIAGNREDWEAAGISVPL